VILTPSTAALQALVEDLQQRLIDLQRSQDANEAAAAAFRASVKTEWQKIAPTLSFLGKYVVPGGECVADREKGRELMVGSPLASVHGDSGQH
jgi:hypothetical protein